MSDGIAQVRLDDGTVVWARVAEIDELRRGGYQDTGAGDRVFDMAGGLAGVVGSVVRSVRGGLDTSGAVEVGVNFGIELSAQSGKIVGVLANAGGTATLSVSLTWTEQAEQTAQEPHPGPSPEPEPGHAPEARPGHIPEPPNEPEPPSISPDAPPTGHVPAQGAGAGPRNAPSSSV